MLGPKLMYDFAKFCNKNTYFYVFGYSWGLEPKQQYSTSIDKRSHQLIVYGGIDRMCI